MRIVGLAALTNSMNLRRFLRFLCCAGLLSPGPFPAAAEEFTNAIQAFLQQRIEVEKRNVGLVIGLVDEQGSRVVSCGKMDNGTGQEVNGDTLFEIGSITKTFTALLLQDMVERGEMKLEDPVANYLPASVRMPTRNGKPITLLQLATHTSGLPLLAYNLDPKRADNLYADFTVEKMYAFLSGYKLPYDPGTKYQYSELGMELLGHVISLKAGTNYESLLVERICRPLQLDSTRVTLTPELKSRLAAGHNQLGHVVPGLTFQTLVGGSGLRSTANDLLKYLSANLGLTPSSLGPLMEKTHLVRFESMKRGVRMGLAWAVTRFPQETDFVMHGGATPGYTTFIAFDQARRRGVVVLSSSDNPSDVAYLGMLLLKSEWQPDRRPTAVRINRLDYASYVGEYRLSRNTRLGILALRTLLANVTKTAAAITAGCSLAAGLLFVLLRILLRRIVLYCRWREWRIRRWRALSFRTRCLIVVGAILVAVGSTPVTPLVAAHVIWAMAHPVVDIRREGDRLFTQAISLPQAANKITLPHITGELLPESETRFFERMSGTPITFSADAHGKITRLTAPLFGTQLSFAKTSDQPSAPLQPLVPIKLDPKLCDACVGQYEFAADNLFPDGIKLTIRRQGEQLIGQASDKNGRWGAFEVYPLSETNFFFTLTHVGVQLNFIKNQQGAVTSVIRRVGWLPDCAGKKLPDLGGTRPR